MKKALSLICLIVIASQFLIGCSAKKDVQFKELYTQIIGFGEIEEKYKPIPEDSILMMTNEDYEKLEDKYFAPRKIQMSPDKDKAVLFLQIPSPTSSVSGYSVESIKVNDNTLTVKLKKAGGGEVDGKRGLTWKWVMLIEVDKTNLKDDMKIVVKK